MPILPKMLKFYRFNTDKNKFYACYFFAQEHEDGWLYFNDDNQYRYREKDGNKYIQMRYVKKDRWVDTKLLSITPDGQHLDGSNPEMGLPIGGNNGGGATAPNASVENAVTWALATASSTAHGYDQPTRDGGVDYDCSSFVSTAFRQAGFSIPFPSPSTEEMKDVFPRAGFTKRVWNKSASSLVRGDILLTPGTHTAIYIGNNQIVHATCNEFGGIRGGRPGDQTRDEIKTQNVYSNFIYYLRYEK